MSEDILTAIANYENVVIHNKNIWLVSVNTYPLQLLKRAACEIEKLRAERDELQLRVNTLNDAITCLKLEVDISYNAKWIAEKERNKLAKELEDERRVIL